VMLGVGGGALVPKGRTPEWARGYHVSCQIRPHFGMVEVTFWVWVSSGVLSEL
jgi:hypothetical protein